MFKFYCRSFQFVMFLGAKVLPWRKPELISGNDSIRQLAKYLKKKDIKRVLIVTDTGIADLGLMNDMLNDLAEQSIHYEVYDKTIANPTIDNIEEALGIYHSAECEAIIGFGGGSPIDCAKGVGARVAAPKKSIPKMKGLLKVRKKLPLLIAVPTTSGTGSEATLAAVITNSKTHEKYAINDLALIPKVAVLDPILTQKLPPHITSTTGMDALTHAIEAYIGKANTRETKKMSINAINLIFENIKEAYLNGDNLVAREKMQKASLYAGIAFTRAYVGNVHAIAHTLGGFYSTPHGLANAVILPLVLEAYGKSVYKKLAQLYDLTALKYDAQGNKEKAECFIKHIKKLNEEMNIPNKIKGIKDEDIPTMVDRAFAEANPVYPVPKIMSKKELENIYKLIKFEE